MGMLEKNTRKNTKIVIFNGDFEQLLIKEVNAFLEYCEHIGGEIISIHPFPVNGDPDELHTYQILVVYKE